MDISMFLNFLLALAIWKWFCWNQSIAAGVLAAYVTHGVLICWLLNLEPEHKMLISNNLFVK